jgi:hypothetical protein
MTTILRAFPGVLLAFSLTLVQAPEPRQQTAPDPDAAALLAAARTALGGDAALDAIRSFVAEGQSESKRWSASFRMSWVRPDKFVIATQQMVGPPYASQMYTSSEGFNGEQVIYQEHRSIVNPVSGGIVIGKRPKAPTPTGTGDAAEEALGAIRLRFAAFALPLFAQTFDLVPTRFTAGERMYVSGGDADRLDAELPDGGTMSFFLDAATHRPVRLSHAPPTLTVPALWAVPLPPGEDTRKGAAHSETGLTPDDLVVDFTDYKCNKGICWPRTFKLTVRGQEAEKVRFTSFDLNAKIDPSVFKPSK